MSGCCWYWIGTGCWYWSGVATLVSGWPAAEVIMPTGWVAWGATAPTAIGVCKGLLTGRGWTILVPGIGAVFVTRGCCVGNEGVTGACVEVVEGTVVGWTIGCEGFWLFSLTGVSSSSLSLLELLSQLLTEALS